MQYTSFMIILYPEDISHQNIIDNIDTFGFDYAYILHDKDFNELGEIKKAHFHLVLKFQEKKTIKQVSELLSIPKNYISKTNKSYINALRYLIHIDDKSKYQYNVDEVYGTLKEKLLENLKYHIENEKLTEILNVIDKMGFIDISTFTRVICSMDLFSYYRRSFAIIHLIIKEHNEEIRKNEKITS